MNEVTLVFSAVAAYVAVGGVVARVLKGLDDEWLVPATMFWPVTMLTLLVVAVAFLPYAATDRLINWFTTPSIPKAKVVK